MATKTSDKLINTNNGNGGRHGLVYIRRFNLQQGSRSIHMRSCNEEKQKASKNYGIAKRMDLEDMRELTRRESR